MKGLMYIDTNAFELIAEDINNIDLFKKRVSNKSKVVISSATVSELSRKYNKFKYFNCFINNPAFSFLLLGSYSSLTKLEKKYYPHPFNIEEVSLNEEIQQRLAGNPFNFNEIKNNVNFDNALNSQINAAEVSFPNTIIKWLTQNPPKDQYYSKSEKDELKQKILSNVKMRLSKELSSNNIDLNYFKTNMIIMEFIFKKHLIQPLRNLKNSDFADIHHIAYSPYMDFFITEKENANILLQIQNASSLLKNTKILNLEQLRVQMGLNR